MLGSRRPWKATWSKAAGDRRWRAAAGAVLLSVGVAAPVVLAGMPTASATAATYDLNLVAGGPGAGPATTVGQVPEGVAVAGSGATARIYVADGGAYTCTVRAVSATGQETVEAGSSACYGYGDGSPAPAGGVNWPAGVAVDPAGDVVIADTGENVIRLVAATTCASGCAYGLPSTVAGDLYTIAGGGSGTTSGIAATSAGLFKPESVAVDPAGDIVIADTPHNMVKLVAATTCSSGCAYGLSSTTKGDIYNLAGTGTSGTTGDGGPGTSAELSLPYGVAVDASGNLLIAATGTHQVRLVAASTCSSACAYGLASTTAGDIYTIAGNGATGDTGDGGPATAAELNAPYGVAADASGNLLIADKGANAIRLVAASTCSSACAYGLASTTAGDIYTIAGGGASLADGAAPLSSSLSSPESVAVDAAGSVVIADTGDHLVRLLAATTCSSNCAYGLASTTAGDLYTVAGNGTQSYDGTGTPGADTNVGWSTSVAFDAAGDTFVSEPANDAVQMVAATTCSSSCPYGLASTVAGDAYTIAGNGIQGSTGTGGPGTSAEIGQPPAVAVDSGGDVLFTDGSLLQMVAASTCSSSCPYGLASTTKGDLYTVAGGGASLGDGGPGTSGQLGGPQGLAVDAQGNVIVADGGDERIRLVAATTCSSACAYGLASTTAGDIYSIAGNGTEGDAGLNGPASSAEVVDPIAVATDAEGNVVIGNLGGAIIQMIAGTNCASNCAFGLPSTTAGDMYNVAGLYGQAGESGDGGPALAAKINRTAGVAVDGQGDLFFADPIDSVIRMVAGTTCSSNCAYGLASTTKGDVYLVSGWGGGGPVSGMPLANAPLDRPGGVAVSPAGYLAIADTQNNAVWVTTAALSTAPTTTTTSTTTPPTTTVPPVTTTPPPTTTPPTTTPPTTTAPPTTAPGRIVVATTGRPGHTGSLEATGSGSGAIVVRHYPSDPVPSLKAPAGTSFYDVKVTPGSSFSQVTFTVCGDPKGLRVSWWDPVGSRLVPVTDQSAPDADGCVTVTVDGTSSPSLSELYGTVFVVPATAGSATGTRAGSESPSASGLARAVVAVPARLAGRGVEVRLVCAGRACAGRVTVTVARRHGRRTAHVVLADGRYRLRAGASGWVRLSVTRPGRAVLARAGRRPGWRATVTVTTTGVAMAAPASRVRRTHRRVVVDGGRAGGGRPARKG